MKGITLFTFVFLWLYPFPALALSEPEDIFPKIARAVKTGDTDSLSKWFAPTLDLEILGDAHICSKNHAKQILKDFFAKYTPKDFTFIHQSGIGRLKYGIGNLSAAGGNFRITIFVSAEKDKPRVQQIRIELSVINI